MPTCVAASPTPSASCMSAIMRSGETSELLVEGLDLVGAHAQHGVAVLADLRERDLRRARLLGALVQVVLVLVVSWSCSSWS